MKVYVPLRYTIDLIGSTDLSRVRKNDYLVFLLKVISKILYYFSLTPTEWINISLEKIIKSNLIRKDYFIRLE